MKTSSTRSPLWIVLALIAGTSMWFYTVRIWSANQPAQFSDLYATWWATHELFLDGRNPYSPEIAHEIQTLIYGAPLKPTPDDPVAIGGGFAYPPYTAFLFWPTIYLSFSAAQKAFICVSVIATLGSVWLWLRTLQFRVTLPYFLVIALLTLSSFPALQALKLQNLSLIAAALIAVTLFLLSTNRLTLAGIFLAASTFKPQFTILLIPWLALWVVGNWRRRRALAWSFLATMLVLGLLSEWLVPGWISRFLNVTRAYRHYTYGHSLLDVWFTSSIGPFISAALSIAALAFCSRYRSQSADSPAFSLVSSLLLAATLVAIPTLAPHTQLLLLPAFLCLLLDRDRLSSNSLARLTTFASWILLAWPWFIAFGLLLAAFAVPVARLLTFWELPLYTSPLLPPALLLAVACALRLKSAPPGAA